MFCSGCGNEIKDGIAFCDKCGTPINANNQNMVNAGAANNQSIAGENASAPKKSKNKNIPIIIAMIAVVLIAVIIIVVVLSSKKDKESSGNNSSSNSSGSKSGKSLTEYSGQVYDELGLATAFYNVIDAIPTIDTRVLKGEHSPQAPGEGKWLFSAEFEADYGQYCTDIGNYFEAEWVVATDYSSSDGFDVYLRGDGIRGEDDFQSNTSPSMLTVFSINVGDGIDQYKNYSLNTLSSMFGNNIISSQELNDNYSGMTYTEVVNKLGSIGFLTHLSYYFQWESIHIAWYCPDENAFLQIRFNPITEEVEETKIYTTSGVQGGEIDYSDEYYMGYEWVQQFYDVICADGYSAFKANGGDLYESIIYVYGFDEDVAQQLVGSLDIAFDAYESYDGDLSSCAEEVEEIGRIMEEKGY